MAVREKGGMYCAQCKRPIPGVRNGHAVRNTGSVVGAVPTLGLSLLAAKSERWHCPYCGGPAKPAHMANASKRSEGEALLWGLVAFGGAIAIGIVATSVLVGFIAFWLLFFACAVLMAQNSSSTPTGRHAGQYRCEKNDHLLNSSYEVCPIDGSLVEQI